MKIVKITIIWTLGVLITIAAAVFQRATGPTHPYKAEITLAEKNQTIKFPRSLETTAKEGFVLNIDNSDLFGSVYYRQYPSNEAYSMHMLIPVQEGLMVNIPAQNAAGKLEYKIVLKDGKNSYETPSLVIRYKDPVPAAWLISHIILMFIAMLLAVVACLMAIFNFKNHSKLLLYSGILLFIGGMILGPIVQKFAFGEYWTGVPFGWDLTDNKTLLVILFFAFAIWKNFKKPSRLWTIIATIVLLLVYSIPHSAYGSELNHKTGEIETSNNKTI